MTWSRALLALILAVLPLDARPPREARWWKGNTHCHTLWSDGDGAPELAADWYKSHGYHFLVLSEHNVLPEGEKWKKIGTGTLDMKPETLKPLQDKFGAAVVLRDRGGLREMRLRTLAELRGAFEEEGRFLFIPGEEVTSEFNRKPVHHVLINHSRVVPTATGKSVRDVMEKTVKAAEEEAKTAGRPVLLHLNHPNYGWAIDADDVAAVAGERFFEVYNGHRGMRNRGDKTHKSAEQIWDHVLAARGEPLYGLATDDAHEYHKEDAVSRPGRGWVMVRAEELTADAITRAMLAGDFYASTGVTLESIAADRESLKVRVAGETGVTYVTRFLGQRLRDGLSGEPGAVLQESPGLEATYAFKGDELYVRATVVSSRKHPNGAAPEDVESAWTQPVVLKKLAKAAAGPKGLDVAVQAGLDSLRARVQKQPAAAEKERELILYTLVQAGVRKGDPVYDELLKAILEAPLATTYKVSLQAMVLERIDPEIHRKRIFHCAQFLVDNQCKNGQWGYGDPTTTLEPSSAEAMPAVKKQRDGPDRGDNSNAQYAALGLRACRDAGIVLPKEVVQKAAQWWRESVHGSPPAKAEAASVEPRGWNYGPKGNPPYGSMTAGAAGALAILDMLQGVFWRKDEVVNAGMNWLRDNFSVSENPGRHSQHLYYYLYALERAATLYGTDKLGKADWYAEGSRFLLDRQGPDGSWEKNAVDTCFAILFLKRATKPLVDPMDVDRRK